MCHWQQWVFSRDDLQEYMSLITVCVCISASCVTDSSECCVEMIYRSICLWSLCVCALHLSVMCHWQQWVFSRDDLQEYMSLITVCVCTASQRHVSLISSLILFIVLFLSSRRGCDLTVCSLFSLLTWCMNSYLISNLWQSFSSLSLCLMKTSEDDVFLLLIL